MRIADLHTRVYKIHCSVLTEFNHIMKQILFGCSLIVSYNNSFNLLLTFNFLLLFYFCCCFLN